MYKAVFITVLMLMTIVARPGLARSEERSGDRYYTEEIIPFDPTGVLHDYTIFALKNNPGLKSAYYSWKAELEKAGGTAYLPDPVLSFGYFIEHVETRVGPQRYRLGIRQAIPWIGKLTARKEIVLRGAAAKHESFLSKRAGIVLSVRTGWFDLYKAGELLRLVKAEVFLLEGYESVALAGYRAGTVSQGDLIRIQIELAALQERVLSLEDEIDTARFRLLEVMGLPASTVIPVPDSMPDLEDPPEWNVLREMALKSNPDLKALGHLVEKSEAGEKLASRGYFPDMAVGIDYIETGDAMDPLIDGSGKDPWGVNLSISIPLWFGRTGASRRNAAAQKRMQVYRRKAKEDEIIFSAREAFNSWKESRRKVDLYKNGIIPRTEQLLETTYSTYRGGRADFMDVITSQRQLLSYRIVLLEAVVRSARMISRLDFLVGDQGSGFGEDVGIKKAGEDTGQ